MQKYAGTGGAGNGQHYKEVLAEADLLQWRYYVGGDKMLTGAFYNSNSAQLCLQTIIILVIHYGNLGVNGILITLRRIMGN